MKSAPVLSHLPSTSAQPYGDAIILFDFDGQPKLGTKAIRPAGDFIFTTPDFPVTEPLIIIGTAPFKNNVVQTNTPLRIIDDIDPKLNPYKFTVEYKGFRQDVFMRLKSDGVDAGELHWDSSLSIPKWRTVLRMTGPSEKVQLLKELLPSSPFFDYQFVVWNQVTRAYVPVEPTPFGEEVTVSPGYYTTVTMPPTEETGGDTAEKDIFLEVGGTDAADLIILPGG